MQRWNWFLAADFQGKWVVTDGCAEVIEEFGGILKATLRFTADGPVYHQIAACISRNNQIEATVTPTYSGTNNLPFELNGYFFVKKAANGLENKTIILTDGSTIIGLCFGIKSEQNNFI